MTITRLLAPSNPRNWGIFSQFLLVLFVLIALGITVLSFTQAGMNIPTLLQFVGAVGTLSLAAATFYNVQQTNHDLRLRKRRREKPLAKDELANVVEPAIQSVSNNIENIYEEPATIEWVYVQEPTMWVAGEPDSALPTWDIAAIQRISDNNRELYQKLVEHEEMIRRIGVLSDEILKEVEEPVKNQLREAGYSDDDYGQSIKVFVSAMMRGTEHFGEQHEMYDLWEENREKMMEILDDEAAGLMNQFEEMTSMYWANCEELLDDLTEYKTEVQRQYGISSEEIEDSDPFDSNSVLGSLR